ncbi:MAG: spore coat protein [Mycoplasmatota bacterium]|nr:spore coat protein [Mycoplasmatota bacterium]
MNNKITNPEVEVPKSSNLNDKDYLNILLTSLKELSKNYTISMTEASNEYLFAKYNKTFEKIINLQRETFELMFKKGWYPLEKAENNKITEKHTTLNKEYQDLEE